MSFLERNNMISVCIATYNGQEYISEQISSILAQLSDNDELVISDDGSTDETLKIIESFSDSRIRIIRNEKYEHGFIGNFENALSVSRGDVIFLADQDDIWKPQKVERCIAALQTADLVVHDADIVNGDGERKGYTYYSTLHRKTGFWANMFKTRFLGCCMAFNRNVIDSCMPFPKGITGHDYWIGMYCLMKFKVAFIDDVLICYRRHGNNVSPSTEKSTKSLFFKIFTKRLMMLKALLFY